MYRWTDQLLANIPDADPKTKEFVTKVCALVKAPGNVFVHVMQHPVETLAYGDSGRVIQAIARIVGTPRDGDHWDPAPVAQRLQQFLDWGCHRASESEQFCFCPYVLFDAPEMWFLRYAVQVVPRNSDHT